MSAGAQLPLLQHVHSLTHWPPNKTVLWGKIHFWKRSLSDSKEIHYCQGLIKALKRNIKLVTNSFYSKFPGGRNLKGHGLQPGEFVYWKIHQIKYSLQL